MSDHPPPQTSVNHPDFTVSISAFAKATAWAPDIGLANCKTWVFVRSGLASKVMLLVRFSFEPVAAKIGYVDEVAYIQ